MVPHLVVMRMLGACSNTRRAMTAVEYLLVGPPIPDRLQGRCQKVMMALQVRGCVEGG
jgi:hypothetical protein